MARLKKSGAKRMTHRQKTGRSKLTAASRPQIEAAIRALSPLEVAQFRRYAARLLRVSPIRTHAFDPEDLVLEAMTRVLGGERQWYPTRVDFPGFFYGCIRSVVFHHVENEVQADVVDLKPSEESCGAWEDDIPSDVLPPDAQAILVEKYAYVMKELTARLVNYPKAQEVLVHRTMGHSAEEIMEMTGLNATQYDSLRKQIERQVSSIEAQLTGPLRDLYGFQRTVYLDLDVTFEHLLILVSRCSPDADWHARFMSALI